MRHLRNSIRVCYFLFVIVSSASASNRTTKDLSSSLKESLSHNKQVQSQSNLAMEESSHEFACSLYKTLADGDDGNIFLSPLSIATAMAMVYIGTGGNTANELQSAMKWKEPTKESVARDYKDAMEKMTGAPNSLKLANKLWLQHGMQVKPEFTSTLKSCFDSELGSVDFETKSSDIKLAINQWVEDKTGGNIKELVQDGMLNELTRSFLVNAIYFKALWENPFSSEYTKEADFHVNGAHSVKVQMMFQNGEFPIFYDDEHACIAIELPYAGKMHVMTIVLPNKGQDIKKLEQQLTAPTLSAWGKQVDRMGGVDVFLPRFKVTHETKLVDMFKKLGVHDLFNEKADLSGIIEGGNLFVSEIVHKAFVEVNEEGTEAAGATGVGMMMMSMPPQVIVNRPFLFFIRDVSSGLVLFMGKITNPTDQ